MKILVVDDERLIAQGVAHVIRQFEGPFETVDIAFSGQEALEKMEKLSYDLVITDVAMPGLSGLDLVRQGKERALCNDFCVLSGYSEFEFARTALQLGVEDYLLKPVDKTKLRKMLGDFAEKQIRRGRACRREQEHLLADCLFSYANWEAAPLESGPVLVIVIESLFRGTKSLSRQELKGCFGAGEAAVRMVHLRHLPAFALFGPPESPGLSAKKLSTAFPGLSVGSAQGLAESAAALRTLYKDALHAALSARCFLDRPYLEAGEFPRPNALEELPGALKARFGAAVPGERVLLYQICWQSLAPAEAHTPRESAANPYVAKMVELVDQRFTEDLTLAGAAKDIGLNPEYAGKLFRSEEGQSFSEYLNRYRIARILECVTQDPSLSFEQLAPRMGFSDQRNFYRVFKRLMQTTPGKYRSAMRLEQGA